MAVTIRLSRVGTKNMPMYRVVAVDSRDKRDGQPLEILGTYNPRSESFDQLHIERVNHWVAQGAQMSETVKKLTKKQSKAPKAA
jgi:small subunit ribosomal protein S16